MRCQKCGQEVFLPFKCQYCGSYFCSEHRLPENHDCPRIELARAPKKERQPVVLQKQKPYEYTGAYAPLKPQRKMRFSNSEVKHLSIAAILVVLIGLSFTMYFPMEPINLILFTAVLTASFFAHEMAHKIAAQIMGFWAEFRLIFTGAILTLISIISPFFKIISPGAVMVSGFIDMKNMGKISVAGPLTNIILSTIFMIITVPFPTTASKLAAAFNAWIALFNLIPFGMFDGFKVFLWNKSIWALTFAASVILTITCYTYIL